MSTEIATPQVTVVDCPFGAPLQTHIVAGRRRVLIDSGISSSPREALFAALQSPPDLLLLTHGHEDHFGGWPRWIPT